MYREDCDILRLLIDELEKTNDRYVSEHKEQLALVEAVDATVYHPPKCIHNLKALLTGSLLVQAQGLLDYYVAMIVEVKTKGNTDPARPLVITQGRGSILDKFKEIAKNEPWIDFTFDQGPYQRLTDFYKIRNDHVHAGGYLSDEKKRQNVNKLDGVTVGGFDDLYYVDFSYCRSVINDVESLFLEIDKSLSLYGGRDFWANKCDKLESDIDTAVYKLYDLTQDEISLIENA